jgi:1-acyl-sn-glycerol-3-phosphate acyltransferase
MIALIAKLYFRWIGWKIVGVDPTQLKRCVVVAAPHTSNYDYPIALSVFYTLNMRVKFLAKKQLFSFPLGLLMRATGGIAVDRGKKSNLVDYMVGLFAQQTELCLLIPPEGTRSAVREWKTGFYHVAVAAQVPILLGYLDYAKKTAGFGQVFHPTGDLEADMRVIKEFYKTIAPKYPDKYRDE